MKPPINRRIFREYDIRGVADRDLDDALVEDLGRSIAELTRARRGLGPSISPRIAVGRDCRLTSPRLFTALTSGLRWSANVVDVGEVATPQLYFAAHHLGTDGAVMITGSHNPPEDNGFKVLLGTDTLHGDDIAALLRGIDVVRARPQRPSAALVGMGFRQKVDVVPAYLDRAVAGLRLGEHRCKVVVDAGNGSAGPAAVALYERLGFTVEAMYCVPDGRFPNHHPDPTLPANLAGLAAKVAAVGAELGIAFDGDGDRLGAVDRHGRILWGDQLMILLGRAILAEQPGAKFVGEVKCSQAMYDELARAGGHAEMWKVGHSLIKARMKETGAALAGEMSGHLFFAHRWLGFDDAIYAGARLLELVSRAPFDDLVRTLPVTINTPELRVDCPDDRKFAVVAAATARLRARADVRDIVDIDGVRANFGDGWGLIRASNTQPALVLRCEAATEARLAEIRAIVEAELAEASR